MILQYDPSEGETDFAAMMTNRQFAALRLRLDKRVLVNELSELPQIKNVRKANNYDGRETRKWLLNGWNTEYLLRSTPSLFESEQLVNAVQWAFPQAYYAAYALTLAYFKTVGQSEYAHTGVIRRFGELVMQGRYPNALQFVAFGVKPIQFLGADRIPGVSSLFLNSSDHRSIAHQIAQFLKTTRERDLIERKKGIKFQSKSGRRKKSLSVNEWQKVSESLGPTSLLSLLYRKRIKSNYQDIDTFLSGRIDASVLFTDLIHVVSCLNLVHEALIAAAIGVRQFEQMMSPLNEPVRELLTPRLQRVRAVAER